MTVLKPSFLTHSTHHESAKKKSNEYEHLFRLFQMTKQYNAWDWFFPVVTNKTKKGMVRAVRIKSQCKKPELPISNYL